MRPHQLELPVPPAAAQSESARELARVWAADGRQEVVILTDVWEDPAAWGLVLVDLARHVARAYAEQKGRDESETLRRLRSAFDAEWATPTE